MDLGANDEQLNFTTVYAIGREGVAKMKLTDTATDLNPLLDTILDLVPPASTQDEGPAKLQVFNLAYDNFLGRMAICRMYQGTLQANATVFVKKANGQGLTGKLTKLYTFEGITKKEEAQATSGDIVMIAGIPEIYIGDTVSTDHTLNLCLLSTSTSQPSLLNF